MSLEPSYLSISHSPILSPSIDVNRRYGVARLGQGRLATDITVSTWKRSLEGLRHPPHLFRVMDEGPLQLGEFRTTGQANEEGRTTLLNGSADFGFSLGSFSLATGEQGRNFTPADHDVVVKNLRGEEESVTLDNAGFQFHRHSAKYTSFSNDAEVEKE